MAAEIPNGYVFVARDILKSPLWKRRAEDRVVALTSIVLANYQPAVWHNPRFNNDEELARGQFIRSFDSLAEQAGLSVKTVRTSVRRLEDLKFLTRKAKSYYSVFTIPKYDRYQDRDRYGREKELPDGAIMIAREILKSSLWKMLPQDRVVAITCLLIANHTPGFAEGTDGEAYLDRGQFHASWDKLAKACQLTKEETQESIARLITEEFIVRDRLNSTVFTIPKYGHYQDPSKYADKWIRAVSETQGLLFELPEKFATPDRATVGQPSGKDRATIGQGSGKGRATDNNYNNSKNGEEGGRTPPAPELFATEPRGAPPPLPPDAERIAKAYQSRFPGVMGLEKAVHQAVQYLGRGGNPEKALKAIEEESRPGVVIWKILDPLLEQQKSWRETFVPPKEWLTHESDGSGAVREGDRDSSDRAPREV